MVIRVEPSAEAVVQAFGSYQRTERGLAERTVYNAAFVVRAFLSWREAKGRDRLEHLTPEELGAFVVHEARRLRPNGMVTVASTIRSFVRFLYATGVIPRDLSGCVPTVASSRFGALPAAVAPEMVTALVDSCGGAPHTARRDKAILLLMARLGLRASEIARMVLEDIHWRAGELEVRGKGGRHDRLPVPGDVGEAIADYIRNDRRPASGREVFLQAYQPAVGMSCNAVVYVSRRASKRAGIPIVGGHRLRHTAATQLLRHGGSLQEVAQVLRQDTTTTTAIYAKVDEKRLMQLARPWSEERGL